MSGPITRARLLELFNRLNEKLKQADVYIVGGAMMVLARDAKRVTEDVDSHICRGRDATTRAVTEIADEERLLSKGWLNEVVTKRYLLKNPDRGERCVYGHSRLTIAGTSTNRMIAMKLHAGRPPDLADLGILLRKPLYRRRTW